MYKFFILKFKWSQKDIDETDFEFAFDIYFHEIADFKKNNPDEISIDEIDWL